jgi:Ketopantoate reductase PanE/ApbA
MSVVAVVGVGAVGGAVAARLYTAGRDEVLLCVRTPFDALVVEGPAGTLRATPRLVTTPARRAAPGSRRQKWGSGAYWGASRDCSASQSGRDRPPHRDEPGDVSTVRLASCHRALGTLNVESESGQALMEAKTKERTAEIRTVGDGP